MNPGLRFCHVAANLNRDVGGPAVSVTRLAAEQAALGHAPHLFTLDYSELGPIDAWPGCVLHAFRPGPLARPGRGFSPGAARELHGLVAGGMQVVHNHGLWMFPNAYARRAAVRAGVPLIISPRGMLEAWALKRGRLKKWIAWRCFERANLAAARVFHATSDMEAGSLRAAGFSQPIAVVPNGVDVPAGAAPARSRLEGRFPRLAGKRWLLFFSRLHPKKGVAELITAWSRVGAEFPGWHLILAGPDTTGYTATVHQLIAQAGLTSQITVTGMLTGDDKACALGRADLFVLPTHSENFGIAIAEALAHGAPVITTKGAPWPELERRGCGWWIDVGVEPLTAALPTALRLAPDTLTEMGARGRAYVGGEFSWGAAARQMMDVYSWCLRGGGRPACLLA